MVDILLTKTLLRVLRNNSENPDLTEEVIACDAEIQIRKPLAAHQVRNALKECQDRGWVIEAQDDFGLPTWKITPEGVQAAARP